MRGTLKSLAVAPLTVLMIAAGSSAMAQSADQIIAGLRLGANPAGGQTRGIKLGGSPSPQVEAPAPERRVSAGPVPTHRVAAAVPAKAPVSSPSVNLTVNFPSGSADLTAGARASLDALGVALTSRDLENFHFRIEGHTDNVGVPEVNMTLSQRRAEAVVLYLTGQYHVAPARLQAVGLGQEQPVIDVPPQTPEVRNRRVHVINLGT